MFTVQQKVFMLKSYFRSGTYNIWQYLATNSAVSKVMITDNQFRKQLIRSLANYREIGFIDKKREGGKPTIRTDN